MNSKKALIYITAMSYAAASLYIEVTGLQFQAGIPKLVETTMYLVITVILVVSQFTNNMHLKILLALVYGALAPLSFIGVQKWINYNGTTSLGPFMALWDLAMAIALLEDI